jgi:C-methyltransferase
MTTNRDATLLALPISPEPLMQMIQGMQVTGIVQAAVQLNILDRIAEGTDSVAAVAAALGTDERGTRILLDALVALGLLVLEVREGSYTLAPLADAFLVSNRPGYLGGMVDLMAGPPAWAAYPRLADAVRAGGTILGEHGDLPAAEYWTTFAPASTGIAGPGGHALAELLAPWASSRDTLAMLDVACGSGLYSLTLAAQHAHASVTLLDWGNVLDQARRNVDTLGLADRTRYIDGDVLEVELGGPYDLVIASHIFHQFSEPRCGELLRRLFAALKPGGRLVVHDFMPASAQPADEPFHALFSVVMLTWSREGEAHPLDTYRRLAHGAGFEHIDVHPGVGVPSTFLIAERPAGTRFGDAAHGRPSARGTTSARLIASPERARPV